jgi:ABC-type multidrug transport system fused ATPase/permease subunit
LRVGQVLGAFVTLVAGFIIAVLYGWKLALLLMIALPILVYASYRLHLINRCYQELDNNLMDLAGKVII